MKGFELRSESLAASSQPEVTSRKRGNRETRIPEIIEVSINVLVEVGYAGYAINRVANDAGIRLSTLQHYFPSRDELLRCTIEEISRRYLERFRELAENRKLSPRQRLEDIADDAFRELVKPGLPVAIFESWVLALREPFARDLVVRLRREFRTMFAGLVGEINPALTLEERSLRGALLLCSFEGLVAFLRWNDDDASRLALFKNAMKVVWTGLSEASE
ncbi:TetR/AcrR family transcriptional regulator [Burkholderia pseudomultivorans]|uniref:TetR/AcrR family transcriptional regulator n=1 Tax=Burkholderia pseudomultivorans TaxID=1207504 RepID=UPI002875B348|nr:TetR/AcrR family transcriptional regulator [Burkholderia pseudomultivorans]MDS0859653.1 TetR/AcrR family transcriptional regulator [Burkholderia pseudomultivorans]